MNTPAKQLYRSTTNRMFGGVCAGIGEYLNIDVTVIRLLFVFGVIFGFGSLLIVYLVMLIVVPEDPLAAPAERQVEQPTPPTG